MLFDELDIERQLSPDWLESKLYCSNEDGASTDDGAMGKIAKLAGFAAQAIGGGTALGVVGAAAGLAQGEGSGGVAKQVETRVAPPKPKKPGTSETRKGGEENRGLPTDSKEEKAEAQARWQDQCFLIEGWNEIITKFKRCKKVADSGYGHVIPVLAESSQVVSVLANRTDLNLFFSLSPAQLSMLVPSVRLFIVRYKQHGNVVRPVESDELYLDDHTEERIVQKILSGNGGRAEAIGLQNFTYEFDGKDPATTDSMIKASLKLLFNSFDTLTHKQPNGASFLELLTREQMHVSKAAAKNRTGSDIYKQCKEQSSGDEKQTESETILNPRYKRIKASIGWALPPGELFFQLFPKDLQETVNAEFKSRVRNMLESLKLHLFLEMTDYDLNFKNDGKIELTVNYRATVEGELNQSKANIFYALENRVVKHNEDKNKKHKEAKKKAKEEKEKKDKAAGDDEAKKKEIQKETAKQSAKTNMRIERRSLWNIWHQKTLFYSDFIDQLDLESQVVHIYLGKETQKLWKGAREFGAKSNSSGSANSAGAVSSGEILQSIFDGETKYGQFVEFKSGNPSEAQKKAAKDKRLAKNISKEEQEKAAKEGSDQGGDHGTYADTTDEEKLGKMKKSLKEKKAQERAAVLKSMTDTKGQRTIRFTFLGDIIDQAMRRYDSNFAYSGGMKSTIRLVTSQIMFYDPASTLKGDKRRASMNIADIPISYDEFLLWWNNKVTRPGRTNYPILDFIKDILTDLVFAAFGYNCVGGSPSIIPNLNYTLFEAPRTESGKEPLRRGTRYGGITPIRKIKDSMRLSFLKDPEEHVEYLILHGSARSFVNRKSDMLENDEKDGIYHLGLGLDRGILKEIKFTGNTLKYATETRVIEDNQSGIDQLFKKFDADVSLYGCPVFRNGQYLFLDPKTMGVDSTTARRVGLGGYYVIYNVSGELNRSDYTMDLKCKFQGSGLCPEDSVDISRDICAMEPFIEEAEKDKAAFAGIQEMLDKAAAAEKAEKEKEAEKNNPAVIGSGNAADANIGDLQ